jgi:hypothetical protein
VENDYSRTCDTSLAENKEGKSEGESDKKGDRRGDKLRMSNHKRVPEDEGKFTGFAASKLQEYP